MGTVFIHKNYEIKTLNSKTIKYNFIYTLISMIVIFNRPRAMLWVFIYKSMKTKQRTVKLET